MANLDKSRPNIVFVMTDDQGYWALGANGNQDIITPNLDQLAADGARFENFFCASPVCSPARASLLTGRIPSQHGVHDWIRKGNTGDEAIEYLKGMRGYTEDLKDAGYKLALSGKWHLGDSINPQKGFSMWYTHQRGGGNYYNAPMIKNGQLIEEKGYVTDAITDNAIEFMDQLVQTDDPFYLAVHYTAPHSPWTNHKHPDELVKLYDGCEFHSCPVRELHPWAIFSTAPDALTRENAMNPKESLTGYYAAVTGVDRGVGRIMEHLKEAGIYENTLVIFTADNGFNCGHHGIWGKGNGTFPANMYDTSIRVPFIAWHPDRIPGGMTVDHMVSAYDFMPTILEYLKLDVPKRPELPGKSFSKLLTGQGGSADKDDSIVIFDEYGPVRMIRTYTDKLVYRYPYGMDEYYELVSDPDEEHNRIGEERCAARILELKNRLETWFERYVNPDLDGRLERVTGNGQLDRAGKYSKHYSSYEPLGYTSHVDV